MCCFRFFLTCKVDFLVLLAAQPTVMWRDCTAADRWRNYLWQQPIKWTLKPLQIVDICFGYKVSPFMSLKNPNWLASENHLCVFTVCDWEGKLAKKLSTLMCLYHIKYYSCTKTSACTSVFKCFIHKTIQAINCLCDYRGRFFLWPSLREILEILRGRTGSCRIISLISFCLVVWC